MEQLYLFFINARHHCGRVKHAHTTAVAVLFITSCAATIGWLESRYQANSRTDLQADSTYTLQQQRLTDLTASIQQLRALAATDAEKGYRSRAARMLAEPKQQDETRARILRELNTYTTTAGSAGTALANGLSDWRFLLWALLALLVDLCPMLCFAHVARTVTPAQHTTKTAAETPAKNQQNPAPALAATHETHPATDYLQARIASGEEPTVRAFIGTEFAGKKLRHADLTQIFSNLEQRGVIARQGNRYFRTQQEPSQ